ncbi:alpha/beta fold hydrolase [Robertkochia solimangrovi]|uniref:alpha/beta fold hydrolase n=1 Tax=Robertkochia solimangrovi TaxID=2213046 RepID=UPI00117C0B94|nr:alpha/beta hydrolase [Robertkochia solimangrovi]TRZ41974.1 alpha/beta hydrolase [Robertkochia solimangrovi]
MKTETIEVNGMLLAYRRTGEGQPLLLCNRFRGTLDTWDPLFLSTLSKELDMIIFDYPEVGYSGGMFPEDIIGLATVVNGLCTALGLSSITLAGWSFGGYVAQAVAFKFPELVHKLILIGTNPPGENPIPLEPIFLEKALIPVNSLEDEQILFFEPESEFSIATSIASHERIYASIEAERIPSTMEAFNKYFSVGAGFKEDKYGFREKLLTTTIPVLILHGDHDVSFAVENWFQLLRKLKNGQMIIYTKAGHAPQHQLPELSASYILNFILHSVNIESY